MKIENFFFHLWRAERTIFHTFVAMITCNCSVSTDSEHWNLYWIVCISNSCALAIVIYLYLLCSTLHKMNPYMWGLSFDYHALLNENILNILSIEYFVKIYCPIRVSIAFWKRNIDQSHQHSTFDWIDSSFEYSLHMTFANSICFQYE